MQVRGLVRGHFLRRRDGFTCLVDVSGKEVLCHLPNPGRMVELLYPQAEVFFKKFNRRDRKTQYDVILVPFNEILVSIDSRAPNRLVRTLLLERGFPQFTNYTGILSEPRYGDSRFDFLLTWPDERRCVIEVKSCTLVVGGIALFPDAPTVRGRRHLEDLRKVVEGGDRAAILFIVQRDDACVFNPNKHTDPKFAEALREAVENGVEVYSYTVKVLWEELILSREIKVEVGAYTSS